MHIRGNRSLAASRKEYTYDCFLEAQLQKIQMREETCDEKEL